MANQIVWCDIPVSDLDRAVRFYSAVLGTEVKKQNLPGMTIAVLPHNDGEVGGCLFQSPEEKPSAQGVMIYLEANGRLDEAIAAVTANGGKILQPKHAIGPFDVLFWTAKGIASRCTPTNFTSASFVVFFLSAPGSIGLPEDFLAQADRFRGHFDEFIIRDPFDSFF